MELLEQANMEKIVQAGVRRQLEHVGDGVDDGEDAKGAVVHGFQLAARGNVQGRRRAMAEQHPVAHLERDLPVVFVIGRHVLHVEIKAQELAHQWC